MYKLLAYGVFRLGDGTTIPECKDNRDWNEYQTWLSKGNTPKPMDTHVEDSSTVRLNFFRSERLIANQIDIDRRLGLCTASEETMLGVTEYLRSIDPDSETSVSDKAFILRPAIMVEYAKKYGENIYG